MTSARRRRFGFLSTLVLGALLALAVAAPAMASTAWRVTSAHGPQNFPPGGTGQYSINLYNIGDADSDGSEVTLTDTLPAGVSVQSPGDIDSALGAIEGGGAWDCSDTTFPATVVTCKTNKMLQAPLGSAYIRGAVRELILTVSIDPGASGTLDNQVSVEGGGAPEAASATDPTVFSSAPAGFGLAPGSYRADLFDGLFPAGNPARQAGSHPFELRVDFNMNLKLREDPALAPHLFTEPADNARTLVTDLPPGLLGNPEAVPTCPLIAFNTSSFAGKGGDCPPEAQIGVVDLILQDGKAQKLNDVTDIPLYNVEPPPGTLAAFALAWRGNAIVVRASLDPVDHSVIATAAGINELFTLRSTELTIWGVPADPAHDALRMNPQDSNNGHTAMNTPSKASIRPYLTLPSQCDAPAGSIEMRADSWQNPGAFTPTQQGTAIEAEGCDDPRFRFEPIVSVQPTSHQAASPTGLDVELSVPQKDDDFANGSAEQNAINTAKLYPQGGDDRAIVTPPLKDAVAHLPVGMAVNPSAADGLAGCTPAQIGLHTNDPVACPDGSKIGSLQLTTPLLADPVGGSVYLASQTDNPFGSLLGLYVVLSDPDRGLLVKLPAKVESDPQTGQLTTRFLDNPQLPFSDLQLHFIGGPRAPLVNPPTCGSYASSFELTSWNSSLPTVTAGDSFQIASGPGGGPCANTLAGRPFAPGFDAKTLLPFAGSFSPFAVDVSREDGTQELRSIQTTLPPGMIGKLAGVAECPESVIASISTLPGTGLGEKLRPACPPGSLIGHTDAAAGAGSLPFHNPGSVYLTGPRGGAPLSLAIVTPIVAGPLDLGSVVVRANLAVDPETAQVHVASDPIPEKIVAAGYGFPLNVRSVRVLMDRNQFTLNPTSCDPMRVDGLIGSLQGASAAVSERFQVGACAALPFKPRLSLKLKGGARRGDHPALRAVLKAKPGEANIARTQVALPHSEFLDQAHIKTICTRVQFAAEACPAGSVYGRARAFTPLLDKPLEGPVYLRSSNNPLPDLVAALHGQIDVDLVGRIDSRRGGIRTTFASVPDAPVSKFVLTMKGGKKGLLVNSRNLCRSTNRATVLMDGHNGKIHDFNPLLANNCPKGQGRPSSRGKQARSHRDG